MKILLYARFFPDSFGRNIAAAAEHMGHTVRAVEESFEQRSFNRYWRTFWVLLPKVFPASQAWRHRALVEAARTFSPDLILLTSAEVPLGVVRELRLVCAAKVAVWYPDALVNRPPISIGKRSRRLVLQGPLHGARVPAQAGNQRALSARGL